MNHCEQKSKQKEKGFLAGIVYGLVPHTFCIAFIIFTVLGVTAATAFLRPFLMNRYFFHILIALSVVLATVSAVIYLKRNSILSLSGIKRKKGYLLALYGITVGVNLLLFMVAFPVAANLDAGVSLKTAVSSLFGPGQDLALAEDNFLATLQVDIPCPGHAPLIVGELKTINGVDVVRFNFPDLFEVGYNPDKTSEAEILSLDVFETYKANVKD